MKRRAALAALGAGVFGADRPAIAQTPRKVHRIGVLGIAATADMTGPGPRGRSLAAFMGGMRELGYLEGVHFSVEARGSDSRPERYPALAAELASLPLDAIVGAGPALVALKEATSSIPIVMAASLDPVGLGLVQSLRRPGGNITGLSLQSLETVGKRLELLKEVAPGPAPVAILWNGDNGLNLRAAHAAAGARGWKLQSVEVRGADDVERSFKAATAAGAGSAAVFGAGVLFPQARRVAEVAARYRLPAIYELRNFVDVGGLMSYGADINEVWRRAATFVHKILKGARPADLPSEQPTEFELIVNTKAATGLGLRIPHALLLRADEVIA
jgi:putative ABC transport system substrate-binding protein